MHGLALNVSPDLTHFEHIVPHRYPLTLALALALALIPNPKP